MQKNVNLSLRILLLCCLSLVLFIVGLAFGTENWLTSDVPNSHGGLHEICVTIHKGQYVCAPIKNFLIHSDQWKIIVMKILLVITVFDLIIAIATLSFLIMTSTKAMVMKYFGWTLVVMAWIFLFTAQILFSTTEYFRKPGTLAKRSLASLKIESLDENWSLGVAYYMGWIAVGLITIIGLVYFIASFIELPIPEDAENQSKLLSPTSTANYSTISPASSASSRCSTIEDCQNSVDNETDLLNPSQASPMMPRKLSENEHVSIKLPFLSYVTRDENWPVRGPSLAVVSSEDEDSCDENSSDSDSNNEEVLVQDETFLHIEDLNDHEQKETSPMIPAATSDQR